MWLKYLKNSINKLSFRRFLATCVGITKEYVVRVNLTGLRRMEREEADKVTNVMIVATFEFKKAGRKHELVTESYIRSTLFINRHMQNYEVNTDYVIKPFRRF